MITLSTLHLATARQVFEQAKNHLLTQNDKSLLEDGTCAYRGFGGLKCAAGCFISDEEYSEDMEGIGWDCLYTAPEDHRELIYELQKIHDDSPVIRWKSKLRSLEKRLGEYE